MEGIVIVNKPSGLTSHDVVAVARRKFKLKQIGHAGTLDPLATGVLILLVGKTTKLFKKFENFGKAYRATVILGMKTTTADIEGTTVAQQPYEHLKKEQIEGVLKEFIGETDQLPPMYSAVKVKGKRLYELARKGIEVEREPRKINIQTLQLLEFALPRIRIYLECSKGTYVRKLAEDVGEKLGSLACIEKIERTQVGPFDIAQAVNLNDLDITHLRSWNG